MAEEKLYFSIGEMARFSGISGKTLRYYDEMGILSPARRDPDNDYRYYHRRQLERALLIKSLKALGMSLQEIKAEFAVMDSRHYAELLRRRELQLDQEICKLQQKKGELSQWLEEVHEAIEAPLNSCFLRSYAALEGYFFPYEIRSRMELELAMRYMEQIFGISTHSGRVRRVISYSDLTNRNYKNYAGLFLPRSCIPDSAQKLTVIPEQKYACIFTDCIKENSDPVWDKLLDFIDASGLTVCGDALKSIPLENGISVLETDYVSKIIIPII